MEWATPTISPPQNFKKPSTKSIERADTTVVSVGCVQEGDKAAELAEKHDTERRTINSWLMWLVIDEPL
jgi:hypothetical protein